VIHCPACHPVKSTTNTHAPCIAAARSIRRVWGRVPCPMCTCSFEHTVDEAIHAIHPRIHYYGYEVGECHCALRKPSESEILHLVHRIVCPSIQSTPSGLWFSASVGTANCPHHCLSFPVVKSSKNAREHPPNLDPKSSVAHAGVRWR
jgi:hypothetical protein